jgi:hypothetical protein
MGKFVDALPKGITKDSPIESYLGAYVASGYKMSIDWVVFKFWDSIDATSYYAGIHADFGEKTPIYKDEIDTVYKAVDSIKANEFTLKFFLNEEEEIELIHQIQIIFEYKGYDCKCMLDGVRIDHKSKTITPFDLKTSSVSVYDFPSRYLTFGYYLQAAFYEAALYSEASPFKQLLEDGYKIQDFLFIVTHTGKYAYDPAVIYVTSREERSYGITGGVINGKKYKGIDTLLAEYDFYLREDRWDLPLDLIESQGEIPLRAFTYAGELANSSMEALDV